MLQPRIEAFRLYIGCLFIAQILCYQPDLIQRRSISRVQDQDIADVTTVLLVDNNNRAAHGRFLNVKPAVGLLTSTARTFIQEGVTTEYATQVLGTTLDNGRLYAQLLTKSSRVLYENNDALPSRSYADVKNRKWNIDDDFNKHNPIQFIKNTDYISPNNADAFLIFPTKPLTRSENAYSIRGAYQPPGPMEIVTASYIRDDYETHTEATSELPYFEKLVQDPLSPTQKRSKSESFSISQKSGNNVRSFKITPLERVIQPDNFLKSKENDSSNKRDVKDVAPVKVRPAANLPTFTVRNEFSPSGFSYESTETDLTSTERNRLTTLADLRRSGKMLFRGGVPVQQDLHSLSTVTYLGFADFTTIVGDTVIVFSPNTATDDKSIKGQVTSIRGEATLKPSLPEAVENDATVVTKIKTFMSHEPGMVTKTVTGHSFNMETSLPTMVVEPSQKIRQSKAESKDSQTTDADFEVENFEAKSTVLAHEQNMSKYDIPNIQEMYSSKIVDVEDEFITMSPQLIQPSETSTPLMLSTPSDDDIAKIFASLAAAAAKATEPLQTVSSTTVDVQDTLSLNTDTQVLGGATTIFFDDDPFMSSIDMTMQSSSTTEESSTPTTDTLDTSTTEENNKLTTLANEEEYTATVPDGTTEDLTTLNEILITSEDTNSANIESTTPQIWQSKENDIKLSEEEEPKPVQLLCSEGIAEVTPITDFKTLTYLTTFYIPVDGTTTTSIKSHEVVNSELSFHTGCSLRVESTPVLDRVKISSSVSSLEQEVTTTQESTTEITDSTTTTTEEQETSIDDVTTEAPSSSTPPIEIVTEKKHVTESITESMPDSDEEIELIFKTLYTTYTYLTTFFQESTSSVSSRKEVITNVVTSTLDQSFLQASDEAVVGLFADQTSIHPSEYNTQLDMDEIAPTSIGIGRPTTTYAISGSDLIQNKDSILDLDYKTPLLHGSQVKDNINATKTYYTTYTYFTTIFVDGDSEISSRTEVYTNYVTPVIKHTEISDIIPSASSEYISEQGQQSELPTSSYVEVNGISANPINQYDSTISREPVITDMKDAFTSQVDIYGTLANDKLDNDIIGTQSLDGKFSYSTLSRSTDKKAENTNPLTVVPLVDGETISTMVTDVRSSSSDGERRIIDNVDKKNILLDDQISSESNTDEILPAPTLLLQTSFTTFTYFTTMYVGSTASNVASRLETVTNVVTETLTPTGSKKVEDSSLPITYFTTFTYWTTLYKDGSTTITSREETVSNVITPTMTDTDSSTNLSIEVTTTADLSSSEVESSYEPTTFYTTYTYFTTSYIGNSTILNSRLETVTNVVNNTDATARAVGTNQPSKNILEDYEKPVKTKAIELPTLFPTGLLSTIRTSELNDGTTTLLSTDVYGSYIDGLYAKVLESSMEVITPSSHLTSVSETLSPTGIVSINEGKIVDAEGISTIFYTTKALGTYIDNLYAQVIESTSSIKVDEEKKSALPSSDAGPQRSHKTGLVRLIEGSIIQNRTITLYQSKVIGTVIDGRYAQIIESTSSFIVEKTTAPASVPVSEISPTSSRAPDQFIAPTSNVISPSPAVLESSLNDQSTFDENLEKENENDEEEEQEGDDDEESDSDENSGSSRVKSRLTFSTRKRTFTPVIRPFASRNRPTFNPKRKGLGPSSATTITRSDFTPTITATPAIKTESSRGRFNSNRRSSTSSIFTGPSSGVSASSTRKFSRPRSSSSNAGFSSSSFAGSSKVRSSGRIQPTVSANFASSSRRGGFRSSVRGSSSELRGSSSLYASNSRFRIRPTLSSGSNRSPNSNSYTTPSSESTEEDFDNLTTIVTDDPTDFTDGDQENPTAPVSITTESSFRRNQNPLLKFRRPPLSRPAQQPTTSRPSTSQTRRSSTLGRTKTTTTSTTPKPKSKPFSRPLVTIQNRARPGSNLFPPRGLFKPRTTPPQTLEDEEDTSSEEEDLKDGEHEETEGDNDYDSSNTETKTEAAPAEIEKRRVKDFVNPIRPFVGFRPRTRREAADYGTRGSFTSRFRRPTGRTTPKAEEKNDKVEEAEPGSTPKTSRYSTRQRPNAPGSTQPPVRVRPTSASSHNGRSQFTLRDKDSNMNSRSNFRRPTASSSVSPRRKPSTSSTASRPKAPRLRNYANSQTEVPSYSRNSNSRSRTTSRRPTSRSRSRTSESIDNPYVQPSFDGTITVTHHIPTEVTIPVVNGKFTEYKNIVTAKLSTEVLGPKQYRTTIGSDGNPVIMLTSENSGIAANGATEVTHFILHETPTTSVVFTPTVIRGRKTSYSHVIPSTAYAVEAVVSTIQPQISANAPLANILLSQLLLGNLGLPQQNINPLLGLQQSQQMPATPTTEYKTRSTSYVTTVTTATSTVIPLTFRGKEILTTIIDSTVNVITATEFITDTIVVTPTAAAANGNQLNSLLLPLLLQQQQQQQQNTAQSNSLLALQQAQLLQSDSLNAQSFLQEPLVEEEQTTRETNRHRRPDSEEVRDIRESEEYPEQDSMYEEVTPPRRNKLTRKKPRTNSPAAAPTPPQETSIITLYVSGRRPGEFSTVLSTVFVGQESSITLRKREAYYPTVEASVLPVLNRNEYLGHYIMPVTNDVNIESSESSRETENLESIVGDVTKYIALNTPSFFSANNEKEALRKVTEVDPEDQASLNIGMEEARYNLATRVMSNGVEVIVAGEKSTFPGGEVLRLLPNSIHKAVTLAPSTLTDHMMMIMPSEIQSQAETLSSSLHPNQFVTKTCLTTYTYLTTYLQDGSTTVSSREQVISNTATEERNTGKIHPTPTADITLTQNANLGVGIFHTTYTYLNTMLDGEIPLVVTSKHTVANTVTAPDDYLSLLQPSESATAVLDTNTYLSTVSLTKTITDQNVKKIISTTDVLTQVVITESVPPRGTSVMTSYIALDMEDIEPSAIKSLITTDVVKTYFVTYTYFNTLLEDGSTIVKKNISTSSDVVTDKLYLHPKRTQTNVASRSIIVADPIKNKTSTDVAQDKPLRIYATKTYLTSFTYFTTLLQDASDGTSTTINSHTRVVENVVTESIENSMFQPDYIRKLRESLRHNNEPITAIVTLTSGHELEITALPDTTVKLTKTPEVKTTVISHEMTTPTVITGSTIIFFDEDDQIDSTSSLINKKTPTLYETSKLVPVKVKGKSKSTVKLTSTAATKVKPELATVGYPNKLSSTILKTKPVYNGGETLLSGDPVIFITRPNATAGNDHENRRPSADTEKPNISNGQVSNLLNLGSIGINSLTALRPVFNAMAGLIQNKFQVNRRNDTIQSNTSQKLIHPFLSDEKTSKINDKIISSDMQNRSPIYIPVGDFAEESIETAESQNIGHVNFNANYESPNNWATEHTKNKFKVQAETLKPFSGNIFNGGISISPGDVISAHTNIIVDKPGSSVIRNPFSTNKNNLHSDEVPIGMHPPPPPKSYWPHREHRPEQNIRDPQKHQNQNHGSYKDNYFGPPPVAPNDHRLTRPDTVNKHSSPLSYQKINRQKIPIELVKQTEHEMNAPPLTIDIHLQGSLAGPTMIENKQPFIPDPVVLPEIVETAEGQPLLVNIQPSQVANVIIPHGSTTALIFSESSDQQTNIPIFSDPSPVPEPETGPGFKGIEGYINGIPQFASVYTEEKSPPQSPNHKVTDNRPSPLNLKNKLQRPLSSIKDEHTDSHILLHQGININVPPIALGTVNHESAYDSHSTNIVVPPLKFESINPVASANTENSPFIREVIETEFLDKKVHNSVRPTGLKVPQHHGIHKVATNGFFLNAPTPNNNDEVRLGAVNSRPLYSKPGPVHAQQQHIPLYYNNDKFHETTQHVHLYKDILNLSIPAQPINNGPYFSQQVPQQPPHARPVVVGSVLNKYDNTKLHGTAHLQEISQFPVTKNLPGLLLDYMTPPAQDQMGTNTNTHNFESLAQFNYNNNKLPNDQQPILFENKHILFENTTVVDTTIDEHKNDDFENDQGEVVQESNQTPVRPGETPIEVVSTTSTTKSTTVNTQTEDGQSLLYTSEPTIFVNRPINKGKLSPQTPEHGFTNKDIRPEHVQLLIPPKPVSSSSDIFGKKPMNIMNEPPTPFRVRQRQKPSNVSRPYLYTNSKPVIRTNIHKSPVASIPVKPFRFEHQHKETFNTHQTSLPVDQPAKESTSDLHFRGENTGSQTELPFNTKYTKRDDYLSKATIKYRTTTSTPRPPHSTSVSILKMSATTEKLVNDTYHAHEVEHDFKLNTGEIPSYKPDVPIENEFEKDKSEIFDFKESVHPHNLGSLKPHIFNTSESPKPYILEIMRPPIDNGIYIDINRSPRPTPIEITSFDNVNIKQSATNNPVPYMPKPAEEMRPPPVDDRVFGLSPPPDISIIDIIPGSTHRPINTNEDTHRPVFDLNDKHKISQLDGHLSPPLPMPPYTYDMPTSSEAPVTTVSLTAEKRPGPRPVFPMRQNPTRRPVVLNTDEPYLNLRTTVKPLSTIRRRPYNWSKPSTPPYNILTIPIAEGAKTSQYAKPVSIYNDIKLVNSTASVPVITESIITFDKLEEIEMVNSSDHIVPASIQESSSATLNTLLDQSHHYDLITGSETEIAYDDATVSTEILKTQNTESSAVINKESMSASISPSAASTQGVTFTRSMSEETEQGTNKIISHVHHAGNEVKIKDDQILQSQSTHDLQAQHRTKVILPTKYITYTQTLTVTTTETTVIKSQGLPPSTLTLVLTKTQTSTVIDTVTEIHTLVQPTSIVQTVTTTINSQSGQTPVYYPNYPAIPVHATAILKPDVPEVDFSNDDTLDEFIINDADTPEIYTKNLTQSNIHENESIFVVMSDQKPGTITINKAHVENGNRDAPVDTNESEYEPANRDEEGITNDVNHVLLGGILIASPPRLESPDIDTSEKNNECSPDCRASRNELCQRVEGVMKCVCRPGFARMFPDRPCKPTYTYTVKLNLARHGKEELHFETILEDQSSPQYRRLAAATHEGLDRMAMQSDVRDVYHGVHVNGFEPPISGKGVLNSFSVQLSDNMDETRLKEVFKKYLRNNNYSLGGTEVYAAREFVDELDATDFDECLSPQYHDCSEHAQCFNLRGTYTCSCKEGFADLSENPLYPGRICSAELIGCENCHYHGTCYSRSDDQVLCECFQWYAGENCHINLKVLLIALVTLGSILFTLLLVCIVLTCIKRHQPRKNVSSGMGYLQHRGVHQRGKGTLDKRAMIQDTSSEGSQTDTNTLPYVAKRTKKNKPNTKKYADPMIDIEQPGSYADQRDRSLTVMIPRAKYHPAPPTSPMQNMEVVGRRKTSTSSTETKLLSYLDAGPSPSMESPRRKSSSGNHGGYNKKGVNKSSTGALVSAGFEVSATVVGIEADRSENATLIHKISTEFLSSNGSQSQFTTLRKSQSHEDIMDTMVDWLDTTPHAGELTVSEARSYDETTIHAPTKTLRTVYDSKQSSHHHNNDEANTMAERDLGSTFLLPHTHLYKPDRGSDISGFDSL